MSDWTQAEREFLRDEVPRSGLATPFRGGMVQDLAKQVGAPGCRASGGRQRERGEWPWGKKPCPVVEAWLGPAAA